MPPSENVPAQVEQEAEELNRIRRKLVMRVEEVLEQEFKASRVLSVGDPTPRAPGFAVCKSWRAGF